MRTNLPRQIMSFSDIPAVMGDKSHDPRRFPIHTEIQAWLECFAAKFHLRQHIRFNSEVVSLHPLSKSNSNPISNVAPQAAPSWKLTIRSNKIPTRQQPQHAQHAKHNAARSNRAAHQQAASDAAFTDASAASSDVPLDAVAAHHESAAQQLNGLTLQESNSIEAIHGIAHGSNSHAALHGSSGLASNGFEHGLRHDSDRSNGTSALPAQQDLLDSSAARQQRLSYSSPAEPPHSGQHPSQPDAVSPLQNQTLVAATANPTQAAASQLHFDAVVICVGNYHQPNLPDVTGIDDFPGLQMHAHNFRHSSTFAGMRVIVVGASFSGEMPFVSMPFGLRQHDIGHQSERRCPSR